MTESQGTLGAIKSFEDQKVLYRSDTQQPLSVVGNRYQVVQPHEVLEFYRDMTEQSGFELETAGMLKAGREFWALDRTGKQAKLKGTARALLNAITEFVDHEHRARSQEYRLDSAWFGLGAGREQRALGHTRAWAD